MNEIIKYLKNQYNENTEGLEFHFHPDDIDYRTHNEIIPISIIDNGLGNILCILANLIYKQSLVKDPILFNSKIIFDTKKIIVRSKIHYENVEKLSNTYEDKIPKDILEHANGCLNVKIWYSGEGDSGGIEKYEYTPENSGDEIFRNYFEDNNDWLIPEEANFNNEGSYGHVNYRIRNKICKVDENTFINFEDVIKEKEEIKYSNLFKAMKIEMAKRKKWSRWLNGWSK